MSTDREIKIGIKTTADTSGAKEAEAAIKKVGGADADAAKLAEVKIALAAEHADAMAKARESAAELFEGLGKISESLDDIAESGEDANEQGENLDENVKSISRAQKAKALADLSQAVGQIGAKFKEAANEIEQFDAEAAASLRQTGERIEQVTGAVTQLALGFAVGGPLGAGVAAAAIGVSALVNAFKDSEVAAIKASAAQRKALDETADATREAAAGAKKRADELASESIEKAIRDQNRALEEQLSLVNRQVEAARKKRQEEERILESEDNLKLAKIDEGEAAGKITKERAAVQRAEVEQGAVLRKREAEKKRVTEDALRADAEAQKAAAEENLASEEAVAKERAAAQAKAAAEEALKVAEDTARRERLEIAQKSLADIKGNNILGLRVPYPGQRQDATNAAAEKKAAEDEAGKITTDAVPGLSAEEAKAAAEEALKTATEKMIEAQDAAKKAVEKARDASNAKGRATDVTAAAADTFRTIDTVAENEDAVTVARRNAQKARANAAEKEKTKPEEERTKREEERLRNAGRDLETDITGLGKDAADATKGLGARGINPEGFNALARKIALKGDSQGDKVNLASFLEKVSMLVDAIPDSRSSSEDAEKLRQVERKLEKKISDLNERVKRREGK